MFCNLIIDLLFRSITSGYLSIKSGESDVIVAGGQESMSQAPHAIHMRNGLKMGNGTLVDTMISDGLTDAFSDIHMGVTGKNNFLSKKITHFLVCKVKIITFSFNVINCILICRRKHCSNF